MTFHVRPKTFEESRNLPVKIRGSFGSQRRMNAQAEGIEQNIPKAREGKSHVTGETGSEVNLPLSSPSPSSELYTQIFIQLQTCTNSPL